MKPPQQSLLKSFANAFAGMAYFFANDRNGKIDLAITVTVMVASIALQISTIEWMMVLLCIALVIGLEMLNSALEKLCDLVVPNYHPIIKVIKDVSAAAVVLAAIISVVIGIIIFLPKIMLVL
ncbi:MAG: diacylglycerol kinase family protein [Flavobacterium sp.]|nr:diacylglycerol kinase family protein [Flavobacterium sp.]